MPEKSLTLATKFTGTAAQLIAELGKIKTALKGTSAAMATTTAASTKTTRSVRAIGPAMDKARGGTNKASVALGGMNKGATMLYNSYDRFQRALKVVTAYGIAGAAIYSVINAMKSGVDEIINYDQALKNLQAITGATNSEIAIMDEVMRDVARSTKFSTAEVSQGMVLLGQAGFDASESMDAINSTAMLATATLTNMATTADLLTTAIRAFGLSTKESSRVADIMANAVNKSKLTIDKIRTAFNFVGASAAQANIALEETAATMMVLANNGMRASTIGTGFRQVLAKLISPSKKLRATYEEYGIALDKVNPVTVGYTEVLKNLSRVLWDNEKKTVNMVKAYDLFKLRGAQAAAIIVKSYMSGDFQKALDNTYEVGTAARMASIQQEGLRVTMDRMFQKIKLIAVALGDAGLTGVFSAFANTVGATAAVLESFVGSTIGSFIIQAGAWSLALMAVAKAFVVLKEVILATMAVRVATRFMRIHSAIGLLTVYLTRLTSSYFIWIAVLVAAGVALLRLGTMKRKASIESGKLAAEIKGVADSLDTFIKVMAGAEVGSKKYNATLKRLALEHPELVKEILRTAEKMLGLESVINLSALSFEELEQVINRLEMDKRTESFYKQAESLVYLASEAKSWKLALEDVDDSYLAIDIASTAFAGSQEAANKKIKEYEDAVKDLMAWLADWVVQGKKTKKEVVAFIESLDKLEKIMPGVQASMKKYLEAGLKKIEEQTARTFGEMEAFVEKLPEDYREFYEKLDILRQADFAKTKEKIDREVAAYEKRAATIGHTEEQRIASRQAITARGIADYIGNIYKEYEAVELNEQRKLKVMETFIVRAREQRDKDLLGLYESHRAELQIANLTQAEKLEIDKEYAVGVEAVVSKLEAKVKGIRAEANRLYQEGLKATYTAAQKAAEEQLTGMKSSLKTFESDLDKILERIKTADEKYHEGLRSLRQKTMTEEEKWVDDREEANRLLNKAMNDSDTEAAENAMDLFRALAVEVKDESGVTIQGIEESARIAQEGFAESHDVLVGLLQDQADKTVVSIGEVKKEIVLMEDTLQEYKDLLLSLADSRLELSVEEAIKRLGETINEVGALQRLAATPVEIQIKNRQARENIAAINRDLDIMMSKLRQIAYMRTSFPTTPAVPGATAAATVPQMHDGGSVPGTGSGDKVIVALEPDEHVITKKATAKYGSAIFDLYNRLLVIPQKLRSGGSVMPVKTRSQPRPMKDGGMVLAGVPGGGGDTYKITFAPMFMMGDRRSLTQAAILIKEQIRDLKDRGY